MRFLRNVLIVLVLLLVGGTLLFTSSGPLFSAPAPRPDNMAVVKQALSDFKGRDNVAEPVILRLSNKELAAGSSLAGRALAPTIVSSRLTDTQWEAGFSRPLPLGRWLNVEASLPAKDFVNSPDAIPPVQLKIGVVRLPQWLSGRLIKWAVRAARYKYPDLPAPSHVLKSMHFSAGEVAVTLSVPRVREIYAKASDVAGLRADDGLVRGALCHLAAEQKRHPSTAFDEQVRRAFAAPVPGKGAATDAAAPTPEARNRASMVALAIFVGGERAHRLFYSAKIRDAACPLPPEDRIKLAGRADLPKHWAISAALSATMGTEMTGALGEWKELSDSLADGTGFSFVDMTANRSGFRYGQAGTRPQTAAAITQKMQHITETALVPQEALSNKEGLANQQFTEDFSDLDSNKYRATIAMIDGQLNRAGVPQ